MRGRGERRDGLWRGWAPSGLVVQGCCWRGRGVGQYAGRRPRTGSEPAAGSPRWSASRHRARGAAGRRGRAPGSAGAAGHLRPSNSPPEPTTKAGGGCVTEHPTGTTTTSSALRRRRTSAGPGLLQLRLSGIDRRVVFAQLVLRGGNARGQARETLGLFHVHTHAAGSTTTRDSAAGSTGTWATGAATAGSGFPQPHRTTR